MKWRIREAFQGIVRRKKLSGEVQKIYTEQDGRHFAIVL